MANFFEDNYEIFQKQRGVLFFEGCLFTVLGIMAICLPVVFTLAVNFILGGLFIAGGLCQLYRVIKTWNIEGKWAALFSAIIALFAGCVLLGKPIIGILALTTILAIYFIMSGITKILFAASFEEKTPRFWIVMSGCISCILGVLLIVGLPETAVWAIGLIVGIDMLFFGIMLMSFASELKKITKE